MVIRLDDVEQDALEQKSLKQGYLYKDIGFDLELVVVRCCELDRCC